MAVRIHEDIKARGADYADGLGISFNSLVCIALADYLDLRLGSLTDQAAGQSRLPLDAEVTARKKPATSSSPQTFQQNSKQLKLSGKRTRR